MHIDVIDSLNRFNDIRDDWDRLYAVDTDAQFFMSWTWLSGWLRALKDQWFILAAKPSPASGQYVGFFPLQRKVKMSKDRRVYTDVGLAGGSFADYCGIVCCPDRETEITLAFAKHLAGMNWRRLVLNQLFLSPARSNLLLARFSSPLKYAVGETEPVNKRDGVNITKCPFVRLPDSWEGYLASHLGSNTRQKARRFLRKLDSPDGLRITLATPESFEPDYEILCGFWRAKWTAIKGKKKAEAILSRFRVLLRHCMEAGHLFMPVLWHDTVPLGALATLADRNRKAFLFVIAGCNSEQNNPAPGFLLHCYSIRHAIENGFETYDFLRGNEPYKYGFGCEERRIRYINIRNLHAEGIKPVFPASPRPTPPGLPVPRLPRLVPLPRPSLTAGREQLTAMQRFSPFALELERNKVLS